MADAYLVDSSLFIEQLRGVQAAAAFLSPLISRRAVLLHPTVHAEVLAGARDRHHLRALDKVLSALPRVTVKSADMERAVQFVRAYTLAHGTGWPDCLLAATCLRLEVPVVTLNDKHFSPIRGLAVIRPY